MKLTVKQLIGILTLVGLCATGGWKAITWTIQIYNFVQTANENSRRLDVLESITLREHPEYWPEIYPKKGN